MSLQPNRSKTYYVYILSSDTGMLYVGVTNDLERRLAEHKNRGANGYARRFKIDRLVYFEETDDIYAALDREKQIKSWRRSKKIALIKAMNPKFIDLSTEFFGPD